MFTDGLNHIEFQMTRGYYHTTVGIVDNECKTHDVWNAPHLSCCMGTDGNYYGTEPDKKSQYGKPVKDGEIIGLTVNILKKASKQWITKVSIEFSVGQQKVGTMIFSIEEKKVTGLCPIAVLYGPQESVSIVSFTPL